MSSSSRRVELSVGLFLLLGIALLGGLILRFSQPRVGGRGGYPITVEVKDASGIREGVPVRLGGVDIGRVASDPVLSEDFHLLTVPLEIFPDIRIPEGSTAKVGTSGLMGDSFVRIVPPDNPNGRFLPEGHRLVAEPASSLNDLAGEADEALDSMADASAEIRAAADRVEALAVKVDTELLTPENLSNVRETLASLRVLSGNLQAASDQIGPLLDGGLAATEKLGAAADKAQTTFGELDTSVVKFSETLGTADDAFHELDLTLEEARATIVSVAELMSRLQKGDGLAAALLNDSDLKRDLESALDKLDRFGFLFYPRERSGREDELEKPPFPGRRVDPSRP